MSINRRAALTKRTKRTLTRSLIALTAAAVLMGISCNWNLKTRTPALDENKVAPDFSLPDHTGKTVTLDGLVGNGPAVVVFYRGYW